MSPNFTKITKKFLKLKIILIKYIINTINVLAKLINKFIINSQYSTTDYLSINIVTKIIVAFNKMFTNIK